MPATFNPSSGAWRLSNGNTTATSPDNNTQQSIFPEYGANAIPNGAKTYYEFTVSGAAIQTAFSVGLGQIGSNLANVDLKAEGKTIKSSTFIETTYNGTVTNGGNIVADPQNNADHGPAPNIWPNGAKIGVAVDRINNQVTFSINGHNTGTFSIAALAGRSLFPLVSSWFHAGPVATLNGAPTDTPAGYTNLAAASGSPPVAVGSPPPADPPPAPGSSVTFTANHDTITVNKPSPLDVGQILLTGHATDASQSIFLDWQTTGVPTVTSSGWVRAVNQPNGDFSASVNVDHPGTASTLYAHLGGGSTTVLPVWSGVPS